MDIHVFTYNEQIILFNAILWSVCVAVAFLIFAYFSSKKEKVKSKIASSKFDWDRIFKWQTIAMEIEHLPESGTLIIDYNDGVYTITLKSRLGFTLSAFDDDLAAALKKIGHENLNKVLAMATKTGE